MEGDGKMKKSTSRGWKLQDKNIKVASLTLLILFAASASVWAQILPTPTPSPTRDINVRVIAICASPVGGEPHEGDPFKCLCFGGPLNGYNATMSPDGIHCPRRTIGPFCFVTEDFMPLYWKETVRNQSGPTTVEPGGVVEARVHCPEGKMVLSCAGAVTVGDTNEPAANVVGYRFPTADGLSCRYVARTDRAEQPPDPCADLAAGGNECPCDFQTVPKTTDCWGSCPNCTDNPYFQPCENGDCSPPSSIARCQLMQNDTHHGFAVTTYDEPENQGCQYDPPPGQDACGGFGQYEISDAQLATCYCRLTQYANELSQVDGAIVIESAQSPPYSCGTFTLP
jgi:hypothetical protein